MVQCLFINTLAIWVALFDESRKTMGWEERVWAYTESSAMVQALAAGYFLWDLIVTSMYLDVFGIGTLAHAVAALIVYSLGFVGPPGGTPDPASNANKMTASNRQLLLYRVHPLGALYAFSQHSLVHGQAWQDRLQTTALQRPYAPFQLFHGATPFWHVLVGVCPSGLVDG
jgi:hypothetical protein